MASQENSKINFYTITWAINNFSYCWQKKGEALASPSFFFNKREETKWKLLLFPRGRIDDDYTLCLRKENDCDAVENENVRYKIQFLAANGSILYICESKDISDEVTIERDLFSREATKYLPQDILPLRCRITFAGKEPEIRQLFARTIINVESMSFQWSIEKFSHFTPEEIKTFVIKSASKDVMIKINLFLTEAQYSTANIFMNVCPVDRCVKYFTVRTFLLNSKKSKVDSGGFKCWFDSGKWFDNGTFPLKLTKNNLKNNFYSPNDVLTLIFELTISTGLAFEGVEKIVSAHTPLTPNEVTQSWRNYNAPKNISNNSCALTTDLMSLYKDQNLCDMKLQTKTNIFPVHTPILGARSPVFRAMFSSEMKEKLSGCVDVSDLDDETVRRLLLYFYTHKLEDLKWNAALQLYKDADKYSVISLKEKCFLFLNKNLHMENACEDLVLSDLHQDKDLKITAQNYILSNATEILKSEEWKLLVETYSKLAIETMSRNWIQE